MNEAVSDVAALLRRDAARSAAQEHPDAAGLDRAVASCLAALHADAAPAAPWRTVLAAQLRLFSPSVRASAVAVLLLGLGLVALAPSVGTTTLDLAAPALAAAGVLAAFGGRRRAALEVELACAVRPYELLLARLVLAVGCDLAVALGATLLLLVEGVAGAAAHLLLAWLGPLLLLAGVNLAMSVRWGAGAAAVPTAALWALIVAATSPRSPLWRGLGWLVPARMPTSELLAVAAAGAALLAWTVLRGPDWYPRGASG